jgi:hypothetical protein
LSVPESVAPFIASVPVIFTMLQYPQAFTSVNGVALGLMESTRSFILQLFLAGAVVGTTFLAILYLRSHVEALLGLAQKVLFLSPRIAFIAAAACLMFAVINIISYFQFHHLPALPEEVIDLFQARIFSTGHASADVPPLSDFFAFRGILMTDRWFSPAPPGYPLLLAIGYLLRAPWLINPLLAAASVALTYLCAEQMYSEKIARGAAMLMLISPFVLLLSSLYLSYVSVVFFFLLSLSFLLKGLQRAQRSFLFLSGLAFGGAILVAPMVAIALDIPWAIFLFRQLLRRNLRISSAAALCCGPVVSVFLFFAYRVAAGGDSFVFWPNDALSLGSGYEAGSFALPAAATGGPTMRYFLQAIADLNNRLHYFSAYLLGWPLPSLLLAAVPFATASKNKWDYLLLGQLICVPLVFFFFFHTEFILGPRYYLAMTPAALILAARGFQAAPLLRNRVTGSSEGISHVFLTVLILVCIAFNFAYFLPSRLQYNNVSSYAFKQLPSPVQRHVESAQIHNAVVFINDFPFYLAYGAGLWLNDPALSGDIIYAHDFGVDNILLMRQYSGRKYYRYSALGENLEEISPDSAANATADIFKPRRP